MMGPETLDPILVEVLSSRLHAIVNDQQAALVRTAFSTVVRESEDLACGVFDTHGLMIAQSLTGTPGHINAMATGMRHIVDAFPRSRLDPGDVLITNDPWKTSGQVNDFTVVTPVFADDRIVGYFANTCHAPDIGGRVLSGEAHDIYEEGLQVPIMKLFRVGEPNSDLLDVIRANVRQPDETVGDLFAQAACNAVGGRELEELLVQADLQTIDLIGAEIIGRSEQALRGAISEIPNGTYTNETWSDGFDEPIKIVVTVEVEGDELEIDFAGSSPQSNRGINVVMNYTRAYASFAMKAALAPEVPHNEGSFRPVRVTAPPGSILNCVPPAAVGARHLLGHFLPGVIFGALAPALPERLLAGGADAVWLTTWMGRRSGRNTTFSLSLFQPGGMGARATKDGLSATGFPTGVAGVPVEIIETLTPLVQHRRELRTDSGGAGQFRGGLGQLTELSCRSGARWEVSALVDRTRFPAAGLEGGHNGALGEFRTPDGAVIPAKRRVELAAEARVVVNPPGGGGYGDPFHRAPEWVLSDVVDGYVSIEAAKRDYGVAIRYTGPEDALVRMPLSYELDFDATSRLRRATSTPDAELT